MGLRRLKERVVDVAVLVDALTRVDARSCVVDDAIVTRLGLPGVLTMWNDAGFA